MSKHIHMVGIGGIGMSALAQVLKFKGNSVSGSDLKESEIIDDLRSNGIKVSIGHKEDNSNGSDWIIYSEAIPSSNPELIKGIKQSNYFEALGELSHFFPNAKMYAVAGTHGKSTSVSMLANCLISSGIETTVIVGTKMKNFNGKNYVLSDNPEVLLLEACEYRENFLPLNPTLLGITNIDFDHPDYFKTKKDYQEAFEKIKAQSQKVISPEQYSKYEGELGVPGEHNKMNAGLALAMAKEIRKDLEVKYKESLKNFQGSWRRFDKIGEYKGAHIILDYAHHPTEIKTTLMTARESYPGKRVMAVFQVHQHSRAIQFLEEFKESFHQADYLFIPDIYACRDSKEDMENMNSEDFADELRKKHDEVEYTGSLENTARIIKERAQKGDVILLMGAGSVDSMAKWLVE